MKLAALFSGGKDSTFAVMEALKEGHEIACLITVFPQRDDSYMFHYPCLDLTRLQAEAMGVRHVTKQSSGDKEAELGDLEEVLSGLKGEIDGVVSGAVSSTYQKSRIDGLCKEIGLESVAPLWGRDAYGVLKGEVDAGLDIMITSVSTGGLGGGWLGRKIDAAAVEELRAASKKRPFNVQFEGGEAETFVTDCPIFKKRVKIAGFEKVWDEDASRGHIVVKGAALEPKQI